MVIGWLGLAFAACPAPIGAVDLSSEVAAIESAWSTMDAARVYEGEDQLLRDVPCLTEAVPPTAVAAVFRALALTRYVVGDRVSAAGYLRAVRASSPASTLPEALVGPTHPLRALFDAAPAGPGPGTALAPPATGSLQIDGRRATTVPADRPFLFQHLDPAGLPLRSDLLPAGATPSYEAAGPPAALPPEPARTSRILLATGVGAAVAGGVALGVASLTRDQYRETPTWEPNRADQLEDTNTALGVTGWALAATGAGLGVAAIARHRW